jgi:hypothetical protein
VAEKDNDAEFQKIADEIWKDSNVTSFEAIGLQPDVIVKNAQNKILFRHRQTAEQDIFWLNNRGANPTSAEISFRIAGKVPELWHPQTGKTERISFQIIDGRTIIPLYFESWDAFFIVFKDHATVNSYTKPVMVEKQVSAISGPWKVDFQDGRGAPQSATFDSLTSWSESGDAGIKYFSGTATYQKTFQMLKLNKDASYEIDLGDVENLAEVIVNGKNKGIVWKQPYKLDITDAVKKGKNSIEIKVTNLWVNRLIGDVQPDVKEKITYTTIPFYNPGDRLLTSGLLGPVVIYKKEKFK